MKPTKKKTIYKTKARKNKTKKKYKKLILYIINIKTIS